MKSTICHDRLGANVRNTQESYRSQRGDGPDLVLLRGANERKKSPPHADDVCFLQMNAEFSPRLAKDKRKGLNGGYFPRMIAGCYYQSVRRALCSLWGPITGLRVVVVANVQLALLLPIDSSTRSANGPSILPPPLHLALAWIAPLRCLRCCVACCSDCDVIRGLLAAMYTPTPHEAEGLAGIRGRGRRMNLLKSINKLCPITNAHAYILTTRRTAVR
eukprot:COSAG06_NODE_330_length_17413_cov_12.112510_11_plen_218_part_00